MAEFKHPPHPFFFLLMAVLRAAAFCVMASERVLQEVFLRFHARSADFFCYHL